MGLYGQISYAILIKKGTLVLIEGRLCTLYLAKVKAKGHYYLYLRMYSTDFRTDKYRNTRKTLFRFGRADTALKNMYTWRSNFNELPEELKKCGCARNDLENWIAHLEKLKRTINGLESAI